MTAINHALKNVDPRAEQYLTFTLAQDLYGVEILRVQEIRGWTGVRTLPNMPLFVKGVLNLRGALVPIIDLRARFGLTQVNYNQTTVVIILAININEAVCLVGMVVDSVADVITLTSSKIQNAPRMGSRVDTRFMSGMAMFGDQMVVLLNADSVLGDTELDALDHFVKDVKS